MRLALPLALLLCAACASTPRIRSAAEQADLAFIRVNVVDVESGRVLPEQTVLIAGNRIRAVGPSAHTRVPVGARAVEARGKYLIPGLWDMHVHLHSGSAEAFEAQVEGRSALLVAHGITGVRNHHSTVPLDEWARVREEIRTGRRVGPRLVLSGPMLDGPTPLRPGAVTVSTKAEVRSAVDTLLRGGSDYINISPTLPREAYVALAEHANQRGVAFVGPVVGVSPEEASDLGQRSIEHLYPIPESCSPRSGELRAASGEVFRARARGEDASALVVRRDALQRLMLQTYTESLCQGLFRRLVENGTWVVPTLVVERANALTFDGRLDENPTLRYISAPERRQWESLRTAAAQSTGAEERVRARTMFRQRIGVVLAMERAGVGLLAGTDMASSFLVPGFSLHEELELLVTAGLSPLEALRTATLNPAKYLEATDSLGTVAPGKVADLVLLEANPLEDITDTQKIAAVVLNGRYLDREKLDELLDEAERAANSPQN